jgi:ribonuclease VapC
VTVLDASALLAYLHDEPGAEVVEGALTHDTLIGTVNLAEVLSKLTEVGQDPEEARWAIGLLAMDVVPFDEDTAVEVARLRPPTARAGLSLGDRACLALARIRRRPVLTAERRWEGLLPDVEIRLIR